MSGPIPTKNRRPPSGWWITAALTSTLFGIIGLAGRSYFGSLSAALDYAAGRKLLINATKQAVGSIPLGQRRDTTFEVANFSNRPIALLGANSSCTCTFTKSLPLTVPPHARRQVLVTVRGDTVGPIATKIVFLTDSPSDPALAVSVVGQIDPR